MLQEALDKELTELLMIPKSYYWLGYDYGKCTYAPVIDQTDVGFAKFYSILYYMVSRDLFIEYGEHIEFPIHTHTYMCINIKHTYRPFSALYLMWVSGSKLSKHLHCNYLLYDANIDYDLRAILPDMCIHVRAHIVIAKGSCYACCSVLYGFYSNHSNYSGAE